LVPRSNPERGEFCLRSGDERVNLNVGLASLHTLMVREHNRVATMLEDVNPHWDEETLYQEARCCIYNYNASVVVPRLVCFIK
jgi:hypothetical protein